MANEATWGMVQMRVTPGPQNQAQRTQSVSPIGLVVNGLHCAASHTHTTSLRCHPHVPTFEPCPKSSGLKTNHDARIGCTWGIGLRSRHRRVDRIGILSHSGVAYRFHDEASSPLFSSCLSAEAI